MPVFSQGGAMTIVAHADDDLLFMNPDIARSIAAGETNTVVYVTAGDAGYDASYWSAREAGVKAAYGFMAGEDDWVDETVEIVHDANSFSVHSATLISAPEVRLYFLRLPDGAGAIADPADYFSLARLEDGTRASVTTVDDASTYSRDDLVDLLTGLMETHSPEEFRLQVAEGDYAAGEHTDHIHATLFAEEALGNWEGGDYHVTHYVNYQSDGLDGNLSAEDAALCLDVMEIYAQHDPGVTDESGALLPRYVAWTGRQYIAEEEDITGGDGEPDDPGSTPPLPEPPLDDPAGASATYSLADTPDGFLFEIDTVTGAIAPKDWFTPSLDDAWDADEDYIYEVTRVATASDGTSTSEVIRFDTLSEGVLARIGEDDPVSGPEDPATLPDPGPVDDDPVPDTPVVEGDDPTLPPALPGVSYLLEGDDVFLFEIDSTSGAISPKDWFVPSHDDAWDQDENHLYELTRVGLDETDTIVSREFLQYQTAPDDSFSLVSVTDDLILGLSSGGSAASDAAMLADLDDLDAEDEEDILELI